MLVAFLLPTTAPDAYLRWRTQLVAAQRVAFFAFPLLRKPRGEWRGCGRMWIRGIHGRRAAAVPSPSA